MLRPRTAAVGITGLAIIAGSAIYLSTSERATEQATSSRPAVEAVRKAPTPHPNLRKQISVAPQRVRVRGDLVRTKVSLKKFDARRFSVPHPLLDQGEEKAESPE